MAAELLPTDRQLPALLRKITLAAQQTGVEFVIFRPSGAQGRAVLHGAADQISVYGDYHQVGSFLAELANMRRIVTVSDAEAADQHRHRRTGSRHAAEFTASAYSLNTTRRRRLPAAPHAGGRTAARRRRPMEQVVTIPARPRGEGARRDRARRAPAS